MTTQQLDPGVQTVLTNMQVIVGAEGGSLDVEGLRDGRLTVRYAEGVNEECPECVPGHDMVQQMMTASLKIYAPHVRELELL